MGTTAAIDRLAMRARPKGTPVMEQNWEQLLFLHWPVEEALLRPLLPRGLEIDTFEDRAWVSITPFRLTGLRMLSLPPIPGMSAFHEINLRTYVHHQGKPGVWFFSLDASKVIPALAARLFFMLPYFSAEIEFSESAGEFAFRMKRTLRPAADFQARWRQGLRLRAPDTESLAFFLAERYALFAEAAGRLYMVRVYHHPWILEEASLLACQSTLMTAARLPEPTEAPLAHFSSTALNVQVWSPVECSSDKP